MASVKQSACKTENRCAGLYLAGRPCLQPSCDYFGGSEAGGRGRKMVLFLLLFLVGGLNLGADVLKHLFYIGGVLPIWRKLKILVQRLGGAGGRFHLPVFVQAARGEHQRAFDV